MSSCTDLLRLNESRLFKNLKGSLSSNIKETRNILEIRDNVLFVWNAEKSHVLTFNIATVRDELDENSPYQVSATQVITNRPLVLVEEFVECKHKNGMERVVFCNLT